MFSVSSLEKSLFILFFLRDLVLSSSRYVVGSLRDELVTWKDKPIKTRLVFIYYIIPIFDNSTNMYTVFPATNERLTLYSSNPLPQRHINQSWRPSSSRFEVAKDYYIFIYRQYRSAVSGLSMPFWWLFSSSRRPYCLLLVRSLVSLLRLKPFTIWTCLGSLC